MVADRSDRRSIFMLTRGLAMAQAAVLTVLTLTNHVEINTVILLALALGIVDSRGGPRRGNHFTVEMVGREDLKQAIAFNAMCSISHGRSAPPLAASSLLAIGEGLCFLINNDLVRRRPRQLSQNET